MNISNKYADKNNLVFVKFNYLQEVYKNLLLPRSLGIYTSFKTLYPKVEYIYDLTISYGELESSIVSQTIYSLPEIYFEGRYPKIINIHVRKYKTSEIPLNDKEFADWLNKRWNEKDELMTYFYRNRRFPCVNSDDFVMELKSWADFLKTIAFWFPWIAICLFIYHILFGFFRHKKSD